MSNYSLTLERVKLFELWLKSRLEGEKINKFGFVDIEKNFAWKKIKGLRQKQT